MMPLMSLTSLLAILRPPRPPVRGRDDAWEDNVYVDARGRDDGAAPGGYLVAKDGRTMPLRGVSLRAEARGGVARVVLEQRFENAYAEPLSLTYLMPLPADAAVSGYAFLLDGKRVTGEIDRKKKARQRFEQAVLEGKTAGLVEQERSSLFTQELGNVPAGAEIVAELLLDQKLLWKSEGAWEWRFPTAVGARYLGAAGQVADAAKLAVAVSEAGTPARLALSLAIRDALPGQARPESPSHRLRSSRGGAACEVQLAAEDGAALDRDVVVRWPVAGHAVGTSLDVGRPQGQRESYGLLTLVPPERARQRSCRRDLILLLDTSGSMDGDPLRQLKRTALALIDSLGEDDTLEMIEFSSTARRWHGRAKQVSSSVKRDARGWVNGLRAGGGTEMVSGMLEALAPLTERSQRQVVLMTDGYIGQEREVMTQVMQRLPRGSCRVHVVGVGSSVNRTLTAGVARAGAGVELILAPGEDAERLVSGLLARTASPLVTHVEVRGAALLANAPAYLPDLYAGSPALISLQLRPEGGSIELSGLTADGPWRETVQVPACDEGQGTVTLAKLFARETVEDLELAHATTTTEHAAIDRAIEDLGLRYQIATRLTTWVAVSQDATVDPTRATRHEVVAQEVPHGTSVGGMGLRKASPAPAMQPWRTSSYAPPPPVVSSYAPPQGGIAPRATSYAPAPYGGPPPMAGAPMGPPMPRGVASAGERGGADRPAPVQSKFESSSYDDEDARSVSEAGGAITGQLAAPFAEGGAAFEDLEQAAEADQYRERRRQLEARREQAADGMPPEEPGPEARLSSKAKARQAPEPAKRAAPPAAAKPISAAPSLRARLIYRNGGQLALQLEVSGRLDWTAGAEVVVHLAGNRQVMARVLPQTTADGSYGAGQRLRLVIDLGEAEATGQPIAVLVAGRLIPIDATNVVE